MLLESSIVTKTPFVVGGHDAEAGTVRCVGGCADQQRCTDLAVVGFHPHAIHRTDGDGVDGTLQSAEIHTCTGFFRGDALVLLHDIKLVVVPGGEGDNRPPAASAIIHGIFQRRLCQRAVLAERIPGY